METDPAFVLVIGLGAVCAVAVVVGGIFDLIVTAYASRRLHDDVALARAHRWLGVSFRLSNPAFLGIYGCIAIAYIAFDEEMTDLFSGQAVVLAAAGVVLLVLGLGQVALARLVNARLGPKR